MWRASEEEERSWDSRCPRGGDGGTQQGGGEEVPEWAEGVGPVQRENLFSWPPL